MLLIYIYTSEKRESLSVTRTDDPLGYAFFFFFFFFDATFVSSSFGIWARDLPKGNAELTVHTSSSFASRSWLLSSSTQTWYYTYTHGTILCVDESAGGRGFSPLHGLSFLPACDLKSVQNINGESYVLFFRALYILRSISNGHLFAVCIFHGCHFMTCIWWISMKILYIPLRIGIKGTILMLKESQEELIDIRCWTKETFG